MALAPTLFPAPFPLGGYPLLSRPLPHSFSFCFSFSFYPSSNNIGECNSPLRPLAPTPFPAFHLARPYKIIPTIYFLHYLCANTSSPSVITRACLSPLFIFFLLFTPTKHLYLHSFSDKTALLFVFYRSKRINQWSWLHALSVSKCYGVG